MKKLVILLLLLYSFNADCQENLVDLEIGFDFNYYSQNIDNQFPTSNIRDVSSKQFSIIPKLGYFIAKNSLIGLGVGFHEVEDEFIYVSGVGNYRQGVKSSYNSILLYYKYYYQIISNVKIFSEVCYDYRWGEKKYFYGFDSYLIYEIYQNRGSIRPGIVYLFNNQFGIDLSFNLLEYSKIIEKPKYIESFMEKIVEENFGLSSISDNIRIGYSIYI